MNGRSGGDTQRPLNSNCCERPTCEIAPFEIKALSAALAHPCAEPKNETAAPAGPRNGGKTYAAKASNFQAVEYVGHGLRATENVPSRATLARKFPKLKINRLTWRWIDDATGARGDDVRSLLAFLAEGAR